MERLAIKYLNILMLCIALISNSAFASPKTCNLTGEWLDAGNDVPVIKLKQVGSKISMDGEITHPTCGAILIDGTANGNNFSFKFYMTNTEEFYCRSWAQMVGTFTSNDCGRIKGEMTTHWEVNNEPNEATMPFSWFRNVVKIVSPSATELIITAEPKMPEFKAIAVLEKPDALGYLSSMVTIKRDAPQFAWNIRMKHSPIPGRLDFDVVLDEVTTNEAIFTPDFNLLKSVKEGDVVAGGVMGGELTLSVDYYKAVNDEKKYTIKGTNPGEVAINQILIDPITRHIACQESRYKQFVAEREGGVGFPVIGLSPQRKPIGGAGIMQVMKVGPGQVWNWSENINAGQLTFNQKRAESLRAHVNELKRLNIERQNMGLPICPSSAIPPLNKEQLNRESIRRYNCGREYRWEPRDAPNCEGKWVIDLSCKRENKPGYDEKYVNNVLSCDINS